MPKTKLHDALKALALDSKAIEKLVTHAKIERLSQDSRLLDSKSAFVALFGKQSNGHDYLDRAAETGCRLALLETTQKHAHSTTEKFLQTNMLCIYVYNLRALLPSFAARFYSSELSGNHFPCLAAVTGTNGKTSVVILSAQLASLCGAKSASIGTMGVFIFENGRSQKYSSTLNTTPDLLSLYNLIIDLSDNACEYIYLEASSHGLETDRLLGVPIAYGVFTNISQDHLDFHQNMQEYAKAKRKLIAQAQMQTLILNADESESLNWLASADPKQNIFYYASSSLDAGKQGCWAEQIEATSDGLRFSFFTHYDGSLIERGHGNENIVLPLIGQFNVDNILATICLLISQGFTQSTLLLNLKGLRGVAGRMELFVTKKASIIVDYAHTPDALAKALTAARLHTKGQLICVFGCGGDRDKSKRALMGEQASKLADKVTISQDNSRSENPQSIINDIIKGIPQSYLEKNVKVELDRQQAIYDAWVNTEPADIILLAGKGHEEHIEINGQKRQYSERKFVSDIADLGESIMTKANPTLWLAKECASL